MGLCPPGMTVERKDNDGDYDPGNCHWGTMKEQGRNKSSNVLVEYQGQKKPLSVWCEELGLRYGTVYMRLFSLGWTPETALK